jgi:hypothetical protein
MTLTFLGERNFSFKYFIHSHITIIYFVKIAMLRFKRYCSEYGPVDLQIGTHLVVKTNPIER